MTTPTPEQQRAVDLFAAGGPLVIEAGAGTGKTSTLEMIARSTPRVGVYIAFNRSIADEANYRFPMTVEARTMHSIAMRAVGRDLNASERLHRPRMYGSQTAKILGLTYMVVDGPERKKVLQPSFLAGHVMRAVESFCRSADRQPDVSHFRHVPGLDPPGGPYINNATLADELLPYAEDAWLDLINPDGRLRFTHDTYLKIYQLGRFHLPGDFVLVDEAQDANPVMLAAVEQQPASTQRCYVGDASQQIYEWRGAVNALDTLRGERTWLTQSFRFGTAIADVANSILANLDADLRLVGTDTVRSTVGRVDQPAATLCRTNAGALNVVLQEQARGRAVHLIGDAREVIYFATEAAKLQAGKRTEHPDLACFESWREVHDYCVAPGARVLTTGLRWEPIESLGVGDAVLAFDETGGPGRSGRLYREGHVIASRRVVLPSWRLRFADGAEVIASTDHRWLTKTTANNVRWMVTSHLHPGSEIVSLGPAWKREETHDAGWLAGLWDGEGCLSGRSKGTGNLAVAQREGAVLDRAELLMKERGFDFRRFVNKRGVAHLTMRGGLAEKLRLLGSLRPERLVAKSAEMWRGSRVEARRRARLVEIEDVGEIELVALTTDTGTFIVEGLLSHNCDQDPGGDELRMLVYLLDEYGIDVVIRALEGQVPEQASDVVVSTAHKAKGREWQTVRLAGDFDPGDEDRPLTDPELRLLYVACTRAKERLDFTACRIVEEMVA